MSLPANSATSTTLLMRLAQLPSDQAAWDEFVEKYGQRIHGWCCHWGLQDADANDVAQTVLVKLLRALQTFRYDPHASFRAWLKTVTHHAWRDLVRGRRQIASGGEKEVCDPLETIEARDDLQATLEAAHELELLEEALARIRERVQPNTWDAFWLTTYGGLSGAETAARLDMPITSIYKAKSNVQKLLEVEVHYLDGGPT